MRPKFWFRFSYTGCASSIPSPARDIPAGDRKIANHFYNVESMDKPTQGHEPLHVLKFFDIEFSKF